jgi:hypothetical protein
MRCEYLGNGIQVQPLILGRTPCKTLLSGNALQLWKPVSRGSNSTFGAHGDLFVEYNVVLPLTIAPKAKIRGSHNLRDCGWDVADGVRRQIWRQRSITTLPRGMESCSETDARAMHIIDNVNLTVDHPSTRESSWATVLSGLVVNGQ